MAKTSNYDRAVRIAKSIAKMVEENGGSSAHVSACSVKIPAIAFDQLLQELIGDKSHELRLLGVLFERGEENAAIRKRVQERFDKS
jgi:hypothetical protein